MSKKNEIDSLIIAATTSLYSMTTCEVGSISLSCGTLEPMDDITPLEAIHLAILLTIVSSVKNMNVGTNSYVEKHNLQRHFK